MGAQSGRDVAFIRGVAATLVAILRADGPHDQRAVLYVITACKALELRYADFVGADVENAALHELRFLDPGTPLPSCR